MTTYMQSNELPTTLTKIILQSSTFSFESNMVLLHWQTQTILDLNLLNKHASWVSSS